jgi:hypothetical protein
MLDDTSLPNVDGFQVVMRSAFDVRLPGEAARYAPFQRLHNKQLLWLGVPLHGLLPVLRAGVLAADPLVDACGERTLYLAPCLLRPQRWKQFCRKSNSPMTKANRSQGITRARASPISPAAPHRPARRTKS